MPNELRHGCGHLIAEGDGLKFSPDEDWVCPGCGEKGGHFDARFNETIGVSVSASATASNTVGRAIQVLDTNDGQINALVNEVQQFAAKLGHGPADRALLDFGLAAPIGSRIAREFGGSVSLGLSGSYYRGRWLAETDGPDHHQFTRPSGGQPAGRYNLSGDSVLYLASDASVVRYELAWHEETGKALFVQEFELLLDDVRVVSVQSPGLGSALDVLLFFSETIPNDASDDPASYRPSQFLRLLADREGVEAIVFPSVRAGFPDCGTSLNLVLLRSAADRAETMMSGSPLAE